MKKSRFTEEQIIGYIPPAVAEANYYRHLASQAAAVVA